MSEEIVPQKLCAVCGKPVKHKKRTYCSYACFGKATSKPESKSEFTCKECGKKFIDWTYRKSQFCTLRCSLAYKAKQPKPWQQAKLEDFVTLYCEICNKEYSVLRSYYLNRGSHCCSKECRYKYTAENMRGANHPRWKGAPKYDRGRNWSAQRKAAMRRDGRKCQMCGRKAKKGEKRVVAVHHIRPYKYFNGDYLTANQLSNLVTLCRKCHTSVEDYGQPCPRPLFND